MQFRAPLRGRNARIASVTALVLAVASFVVIAFASDGYPLNKVDLNDGSVWVTNGDLGAVGRFNAPIAQLDADIVANHAAQPDVDVLQQGGTVFAIDRSANTLRAIDVAQVALSDDTADLPPGADVALGGDTVAISDPATGRVWIRTAAAAASFSLANAKPAVVTGPHDAIAVGTDGTAYAFAPSTGMLTAVTGPASPKPTAIGHRTGLTGESAQVTTVGARPVVLVGSRLLLPGGKLVTVPSAAGAVLQQSGPDNGDVFVATDAALLRISLGSGAITTVYAGGGGSPAAPVYQSPCVYAAWGGNTSYLRRCAGAPAEDARTLLGLPASPRLVFRVNRGVVVLNEVATGAVYIYTRGGKNLGNWQSLTPKPLPAQSSKGPKPDPVEKQNHAPQARPDSYGGRPGATEVLHVLDNDGDADNDVLIIASVSGLPAAAGRLAIVANGQAIQFTALVTWAGTATFTYRINDGNGGSDATKVTLTARASGSNQPPAPVKRENHLTDAAGGVVSGNVLDNWRDPDGDPLTLVGASVRAPDSVAFTADGKLTFTDASPVTGNRSVAVTVSDGTSNVSGTMTVKVVAPSKGPIGANDDRVTGVAGEAITIHPLDNDTDPNTTVPSADEDALRLLSVSPAQAGTTVTPEFDTDTIRFIAQHAQTYYVTYHAGDHAQTGKARIRVDVITPTAANPPVAVSDRAVLRGTRPTDIDVLANDIDPSGGVLVVGAVTAPAGLTATVIAHRWIRITSAGDGTGSATVHYKVSDGEGTDTGAVIVTQLRSSGPNEAPVALPDKATVRAGDVTTIGVLGNDSDPEGEPLTLDPTIVPDGTAGTWAVTGKSIRFVAPAKAGTVYAHYAVTDPEGAQTSAMVTVTVVAPNAKANQPPEPPTIEARAFAGTSTRIPVPLSGIDPDGDSVVLLGATDSPALGRIAGQGPGYLVYQAYTASSGTDSFTYAVQDQYGAKGFGTIRIGVAPRPGTDAAPAAADDTYTVSPGVTVNVPVLVNDSDADGDPLTVEPLAPLNPGLPSGTVLNKSVITIRAGSHNGDKVQVRYGISDGRGQRAEATVTIISATGAKVAPVALDDVPGQTATGTVTAPVVAPATATSLPTVTADVLANDYDVDGGAGDLTLKPLDGGSKHPSTATPKGLLIQLTPEPRLVPYEITDSDSQTAMAFVQVPGTGSGLPHRNPDAPGLEVKAGGSLTVTLASQITDPAGLPVRLTDIDGISTSPKPGLSLAATGLTATSLVLRAGGQYSGPASLVVTVTDAPATGSGAAAVSARTASITLPVTVLPPPGATPVFSCPAAQPQAGGLPVTVQLATCVTGISPAAAARLTFSQPGGVASGVTAHLSGTALTISAGAKAKTGTLSAMTFTVTDATGNRGPARLGVLVSEAPRAKPADDSLDMNAGTTARVNVTRNDENPFPGTPLNIVTVKVLDGGNATAKRLSSSDVQVSAPVRFHGQVTIQYTVRDASGNPARDTYGTILVNVRGLPGAPGTPVEENVGAGFVDLSWKAAIDNGARITGYKVTGSPSYSHLCQLTVCHLTGLRNGTKYTFRVQAVNAVGTGPAGSASAPIEPDVIPDQPAPPITTFGDGEMTLDWVAPHSAGSPVKAYVVEISPGNTLSLPQTGTHLVWHGLTNGTSYTFRVEAFNDSPKPSMWSLPSKPDFPAGPPGAPNAPAAAGKNDGIGKQIKVDWQAPATNGGPITAYHLQVYKAGSLIDTVDVDASTTTATVGVVNGVPYTFRVIATNKAGDSPVGAASAPTVAHGKPAVVTSFTVSDHNGSAGYDQSVHYDLAAPDDNGMAISRYEFSRDGGASVDATSTSTSGLLGGLANGNSYQFKVRACNDKCGDWSSASATVIPYGLPKPPNAGASPNGNKVTLSWSSSGDNGRAVVRIEISIDNGAWSNGGMSGSQNVGNGDGSHSIRTRAVDSAGQTGPENAASASASPPTVGVSPGVQQGHVGCNSPCYYIHLTLSNFPSNASVTCSFNSQHGGGFLNFKLTTDGSGNWSGDSDAWYGYPNSWVSATCNGVFGQATTWP